MQGEKEEKRKVNGRQRKYSQFIYQMSMHKRLVIWINIFLNSLASAHCITHWVQSVVGQTAEPVVASLIPFPYFPEIISTVILLLLLIQEGLLSVTSESMRTKYWITA